MSAPHDAWFCSHCGDRLPRYGAAPGYCGPCARRLRPFVPDAHAIGAKDPLLATALTCVVPGAGQVYNGHFLKAVLVFVTSPLVIPWVIGIADAYFSARRIRDRSLAAAPLPAFGTTT